MITRARRGLVIIGDMRTLKRDPAWSAYIDWAKDAGYLRQVWTSLGRQCPSMDSLTCSWTWAAKETASIAMRPCSYKTWDMGRCINLCHVKTMCLSSCFNQWTENLVHIQRPSPLEVYPQRSWECFSNAFGHHPQLSNMYPMWLTWSRFFFGEKNNLVE